MSDKVQHLVNISVGKDWPGRTNVGVSPWRDWLNRIINAVTGREPEVSAEPLALRRHKPIRASGMALGPLFQAIRSIPGAEQAPSPLETQEGLQKVMDFPGAPVIIRFLGPIKLGKSLVRLLSLGHGRSNELHYAWWLKAIFPNGEPDCVQFQHADFYFWLQTNDQRISAGLGDAGRLEQDGLTLAALIREAMEQVT